MFAEGVDAAFVQLSRLLKSTPGRTVRVGGHFFRADLPWLTGYEASPGTRAAAGSRGFRTRWLAVVVIAASVHARFRCALAAHPPRAVTLAVRGPRFVETGRRRRSRFAQSWARGRRLTLTASAPRSDRSNAAPVARPGPPDLTPHRSREQKRAAASPLEPLRDDGLPASRSDWEPQSRSEQRRLSRPVEKWTTCAG